MPAFPTRLHPIPPRAGRSRGSVLITALLVAAVIAVVLASYLTLNLNSSRLARRGYEGYAALNLAEAGTEEGVWSFNRASAGDNAAWDGWTNNGTAAWQRFSNFSFTGNATGSVKVYASNLNPPSTVQPKIVAQSTVSAPGELPVTKMIEVTLRRRSYFANGLVAKQSITFNGNNTSVDSWNSDPDNNAATAAVDYSAAVRSDHGSVASLSVASAAVSVNQANVYGYVATGGAMPQVGTQGTIRGANTPANVAIDLARVSTDFSADFNVVPAPTDGTFIGSIGATLGAAGTTTRWRVPNIILNGNQSLTLLGNTTVIVVAGSGSPAIDVTGNASIIVAAGAQAVIYAEGNVKIAGKGLANGNVQPVSFQLWGTNTGQLGQSVDIAGNGTLRAVVYAPNGDVKINGNGAVMGSVVARSIVLVGNAAFHYDESLTNYGGNAPFGISKWRELTSAADRATYTSVFSGW